MATARRCDLCSEPYIAQRSSSKYCSSSCRGKASLVERHRSDMSERGTDVPLVGVIREYLDGHGALMTPLGQSALVLAGRIAAATDSGAGIAALNRELRATIAEALAGAASSGDNLDEMKARRDAKRARAATG